MTFTEEDSEKTSYNIALVDRFQFAGWYTFRMAEHLARLLRQGQSLYLYAPKACAIKSVPFALIKPFWSPSLYPFQITIQALRDGVRVVHIQFEFATFGAPYSTALLVLLLLLLRITRRKVIVTLHGPIFSGNGPEGLFRAFRLWPSALLRRYCILIYKIIESLANVVIVHAAIFKEWLNEHGIEKCHVIPHGVEVTGGSSDEHGAERKVILCFGATSPRKGLETLIEAFSKVHSEMPGYKLVIAGGENRYYRGRYFTRLTAYSEEKGIGDKVILTGYVDEVDIPNLFEQASVVVVPYPFSISASGPLAMAMGFGKPIIATRTEYFSEVLDHGKDALLVPPEDADTLADTMLYLCQDEELRRKLSHEIRRKAGKYRWEEVAGMTRDLYDSVLGK